MVEIAICDDDIKLCSYLEKMIMEYAQSRFMDISVMIYYTGNKFLSDLPNRSYDMVFLDICLKDINGIDVGKRARETPCGKKLRITYISTFKDYALQLFRIHPYDFLIKPIYKGELERVLDELAEILREKNKVFQYRVKNTYGRIPYRDIMYFFSEDKKIHIVTPDREIIFWGKLKEIQAETKDYFLLIHKSFLINCDYVYQYGYSSVIMEDGAVLNISKSNRVKVRERLLQMMENKKND